jgi:hypothetical protein
MRRQSGQLRWPLAANFVVLLSITAPQRPKRRKRIRKRRRT